MALVIFERTQIFSNEEITAMTKNPDGSWVDHQGVRAILHGGLAVKLEPEANREDPEAYPVLDWREARQALPHGSAPLYLYSEESGGTEAVLSGQWFAKEEVEHFAFAAFGQPNPLGYLLGARGAGAPSLVPLAQLQRAMAWPVSYGPEPAVGQIFQHFSRTFWDEREEEFLVVTEVKRLKDGGLWSMVVAGLELVGGVPHVRIARPWPVMAKQFMSDYHNLKPRYVRWTGDTEEMIGRMAAMEQRFAELLCDQLFFGPLPNPIYDWRERDNTPVGQELAVGSTVTTERFRYQVVSRQVKLTSGRNAAYGDPKISEVWLAFEYEILGEKRRTIAIPEMHVLKLAQEHGWTIERK